MNSKFEKNFLKKENKQDEILDFLETRRAAQLDETFFSKQFLFTEFQKQKIIEYIIRKDKKFRNNIEIAFLSEQLQKASFIQKIKTQISGEEFDEFIRNLKYEKFAPSKPIFYIGDEGNKFYLILKGSVIVMIPMLTKHLTKKEIKSQTKVISIDKKEYVKHTKALAELMANQICTPQINKEEFIEEVSDFSIETSPKMEIIRLLLEINPELRIIRVLSAWDQFGEIALFNKAVRSATIIAFTPCKFATMNSAIFQKILKTYQDNVYRKYMKFLESISIFENWPLNKLTQVRADIIVGNYIKGQTIYNEGDMIDKLFIVEEGEIEITKQVRVENQFSAQLQIDQVFNYYSIFSFYQIVIITYI